MIFSSLNIDADGSQKMSDFGKKPNQGIFRGRPSGTKARCFPPDYVEAPKTIQVTIGDKTIEKPCFRRNPPLKIFASLETPFLFGQGPEVT